MKISKVMVVVLAGCLTGRLFAMDDTIFGTEFMEQLQCLHEKNPETCRTFINRKNGPDGCTMLHVAAEKADAACVKQLLVFGARVGMQDAHGKTPLCYASARTDENTAAVVLALKGSLSEVDMKDECSK